VKTNSEILNGAMNRTIKDGEISYQANRRAIREFDIFRNDEEGRRELMVMIEGLDVIITDLEIMGHDFETVARKIG
jgi:hypothetical protein